MTEAQAVGAGGDRPPRRGAGLAARSNFLRVVLGLATAFLVFALWRLQVLEAPLHGRAAEANRIRLTVLPPPRGVIYDRSGRIVAANAPVFAVSLIEADVPPGRLREILERLAALLGTNWQELERSLDQRRVAGDVFAPVLLRTHLSRDLALAIEEHSWELPGVRITVESAREYPDGELLAHVLGYLTQPSAEEFERKYRDEGYAMSDRVGAAGVEAAYESVLRGTSGARLIEVDVGGRPLSELQVVPPEPGRNLRLSIDLSLQRRVTEILKARLPADSSGVAVVAAPGNGEILALVSLPSFDPNVFSRPEADNQILALLADPRLPLFHRAVAGQYPPGSTFKLAVAVGALQERVADRSTRIRSNGGLRVPNPYDPRLSTWFPDWAVLGDMNFVQGLALSSNVYFATLAGGFAEFEGLGVDRVARYARLVGYGGPTEIDLPAEEDGRVPTPAWKLANFGEGWLTGDTYNMAIGQGFVLATPLQVANVTNAVASGGTLVRPHVGQAVLDQHGKVIRSIAPPPLRQLGARSETLQVIREGMLATLDTDQLRAHRIPELRVAGKTGTAEYVGPRDAAGRLPTHGWFTAFAPYEDPQVTVTVFVERGGGPANAAPIAMELFRAYFQGPRGLSPSGPAPSAAEGRG